MSGTGANYIVLGETAGEPAWNVRDAQRMGRKSNQATAMAVMDTQSRVDRQGTKRKGMDMHGAVDASIIVRRKRQRKTKE